jgi:hypothetical protein
LGGRLTDNHKVQRRWWQYALAAALVSGVGAVARGYQDDEPPEIARPAGSGRVVRVFDFEERADTTRADFNPEPVPRGWFRAQASVDRERPGFPSGNQAAYDLTMAHDGRVSMRLPTAGGSTSLRLSAGVMPVFTEADYRLTAYVRTSALQHARAFVRAALIDPTGTPIAGSERTTAPISSAGSWTKVELVINGGFADASFLQIELCLLQPEQFYASIPGGRHGVWKQDLSGAAWFDDVIVTQLPRVDLQTSAPGGILAGPAPSGAALFNAVVSDLAGEPLDAVLTLTDTDGQEVAREQRRIQAGGDRFAWNPRLPRLGWYEARMELSAAGRAISATSCSLIWVPQTAATPEERAKNPPQDRFGLALDQLSPWAYASLPEALRAVGTGFVGLPLPPVGDAHAAQASAIAEFRRLLDRLLNDQQRITLGVLRLSPDLAGRLGLGTEDALGLLDQPEATWLPLLRPLFEQYGQRIHQWQVGSSVPTEMLPPARLAERLKPLRVALERLVPGPVITVPWRGQWPWPDAKSGLVRGPYALSLAFPMEFPASAAGMAAGGWPKGDDQAMGADDQLTIVIPGVDEAYGRRAGVIDTAQRAIELFAAFNKPPSGSNASPGRPRLALAQPWRPDDRGHHGQFNPEPTLAVWRTLVHHLGGRWVIGTLPTPAGVRCLVLADDSWTDRGGGGALVMWSDQSAEGAGSGPTLEAYLGADQVRVVDIFGNQRLAKPVDAAGLFRFTPGATPEFVEGIDPNMALFMRGFRVEPDFVPAIAAEHRHEVVISNPWPVRISGEVRLAPPAGRGGRSAWRFSPTTPMAFSIAPGESQRLPFAFSFGAGEEAGPTAIQCVVNLKADRSYEGLKLAAGMTLGLQDLDLQPQFIPTPNVDGPDAIVLATVTNTGASVRTLKVAVQAPGAALQEQSVSNLSPGESAIRRFLFPGAVRAMAGQRIRVTLSDIDGNERLNKSVRVP